MNTRIDLLNGHGWPAYLWVIVTHGLVFGLVGPAIGTLFSPGLLFLPFALLFAYIISFIAAVITGLIVGAIAPFLPPRMPLYVASMFIGATCAIVFPFGFAQYAAPVGIYAMYAIAGAFAGLFCTRMTKSIRMRWLQA